MNYFARTVSDHILPPNFSSIDRRGRKRIITIPTMPEASLLAVAEEISNTCLKDGAIRLILKIAASLSAEWSSAAQQRMKERGWDDPRGSLTYYRSMPPVSDKCTFVVLCGFDQVTDAASLSDFHTCDPDMIWRVEMGGSFKKWTETKFLDSGLTEYSDKDLAACDRVMRPIFSCGRGDLLQISAWLDALDLSQANSAAEVPRIMLTRLQDFDLPLLGRFPLRLKRKSVSFYFNKSTEFFNYTLFLEPSRRSKALKAVNALIDRIQMGEVTDIPVDDEDVCGPYASGEEFLEGLRRYIENDDPDERERLLQCDFVVVWDRILKFKERKERKKRETVRKLSGGPVEVFLTACWQTLREYYKTADNDDATITTIAISGDLFKHDIDGGGDGENDGDVVENSELARQYLVRLLGGIDSFLAKYLNFHNDDGQDIECTCRIVDPDIPCRYSKNAEPALEFSVNISSGGEEPFRRRFAWRLPEHQMYRLAADLLLRAGKAIKEAPDVHVLPAFHIPYFDEMVHTTSEEEIRRILLHGVQDEQDTGSSITNLLGGEWGELNEPLTPKLKTLAESYDLFVQEAAKSGLFSALFSATSSPWRGLRKAYEEAFDTALSVDTHHSSLAGLLCRAFLIIRRRKPALGETWYADSHEEAAVATVLHPAVVEMFEAQAIYLTSCFNYAVNHALGSRPDKTSFAPHVWKTYVDLADIQAPLPGLLENEQQNLNANVRGQELIHVIGSLKEKDAPLSTRLLLRYGEGGDDEGSLSDTELFRENSESRLIQRLLLEYLDLHPHARDSLSIAIYRNRDIQPVIAAVHSYLKTLAAKPTGRNTNPRYVLHQNRTRPYAISITLFTESNDEADVARWVNEWRERWEAAETESKYELYRLCRFSLAHRIIEGQAHDAFQRLLKEQFESDVAFFCDFISTSSGVSSFEKVEPFNVLSRKLKFPILEKACCTVDNPAERYRRRRVVSNRQFTLGERYANLLHSLQTGIRRKGSIVVGTGDFTPWRGVIDATHKSVEWVICIDPNMDERLIKTPQIESDKEREIIGFGSGVGSHGEDNYTISTERFSFTDIYLRLKEAIHSLYSSKAGWSPPDCETVAGKVLSMAPQLSGLSLVRATGVEDQHIRDFMAYAITRKMLSVPSPQLCDCLISLDAYRHWFDLAEDRRQPDLLHLQARIDEENRLAISMHLVECKLADQVDKYLDKARSQINNGLKVLVEAFTPLSEQDSAFLEDDHPDRRFWWMQLHRLIASKTEVGKFEYPKVLAALERLAEGEFTISWKASVLAFQVDEGETIECLGYWSPATISDLHAKAFLVGGEFVRKLFVEDDETEINLESFTGGTEFKPTPQEEDNEQDIDDIPWNDDDIDDEDEDEGLEDVVKGSGTDFKGGEQKSDGGGQYDSHISATDGPANEDIPSETDKEISRVKITDQGENIPQSAAGRIFLGRTIKGDQPVYWEFSHPDLVNRHLLIFGSSGQGKTYAIQCLLCEMSRFQQNSLIIDYTNGFLPNQLETVANEMLQPQQHVIKNDPLPINPFIPQESNSGGIIFQENANDIAKRIAGLFDSVYQIGDQQYSVLHQAIMDGVKVLGREMNLDQMLAMIESLADDKRFKAWAQSLQNKLRPFVLDRPFRSGEEGVDWEYLFNNKKPLCNIFQLAGMDQRSSRLITEFILWDLYGYLQAKGQKSDPKVVVLDEVQNLDHKEGSPLSKYLREGRKFGLSLILATQTMSNMKKDERDRMFQAEHKLFFKPADTELKAFADIAALATRQRADDWVRRLSSLAKGECYSIGKTLAPDGTGLVSRALKIRITALDERGFKI